MFSHPAQVGRRHNAPPWIAFGFVLVLMIGFRYQVGGDWGFENRAFLYAQERGLIQIAERYDPGFAFLIWIFAEWGPNVWTLNLACGAIFTCGLIIFCRHQPLPWLCVTVAIPYLTIVVAMGYGRQSVAIGLTMIALVALQDRSLMRYVLYTVLAASVHVTATLLMPIGIITSRQQKIQSLIIGIPAGIALFVFLLQDKVDSFVAGYIDAEYQSQGALIRVTMNALPAVLFVVSHKRFELDQQSLQLWIVMALIAIGFVPLLYLSPSSTAVDRMALYFIPLQIFVLGRLPLAWSRSTHSYRVLVIAVILYSAAVLFVWLNFAAHSQYWLPYRVFPLDALFFING